MQPIFHSDWGISEGKKSAVTSGWSGKVVDVAGLADDKAAGAGDGKSVRAGDEVEGVAEVAVGGATEDAPDVTAGTEGRAIGDEPCARMLRADTTPGM